nr:hypothetical protein [Anaerolineae bacterium]
MSHQQIPRKHRNPFIPLLGFILLIVIGGGSYLVAPVATDFLQTTSLSIRTWSILPLQFPPEWPSLVTHLVVAFGIFFVVFVLLLLLAFLLMKPPADERDVNIAELRAERDKKRRRK